METINELREIANTEMAWMEMAPRDFVRIADAIEREIAEKYMELPVDADGEPIHVGDEINIGIVSRIKFGLDTCHVEAHNNGTIQCLAASKLHHVKPDPIKELLEDYAGKRFARSNMDLDIEGLTDDYAAKIREAVSANE